MRGNAPGGTTKAILRQTRRSLPFVLVPLAVLMIGLLLSGPSWAAQPVDRNASPTVDGPGAYLAHQALVRFRSGLDPAAMARVNASMGATVLKSFWVVPNLQLVRLPAGISGEDEERVLDLRILRLGRRDHELRLEGPAGCQRHVDRVVG